MSVFTRLLRREDPHSLAAPYALDALDPAERRRFGKHLAGCGRCTAEVRELSEDAVRLAWSTAAPAPAALRERVLAAVRTTPQEPAPAGRPRTAQLPPHVWGVQPPPARARRAGPRPLFVPFATVTAAAALVVASLFAVQAHRTEGRLAAERARARDIAHVLAAPDARATAGTDGHGRALAVVASSSEGRAVVTLSGYGSPSGGRVHQLWLTRPGAGPRSLGLLSGDTPLAVKGLEKSSVSLAVTVEPNGGSVRPSGQPLVQLTLKSVGFGE
ncbi:anti-sigma factor domain-containing protein [Streptomyces griseoluteus]|uniref:anti-sigma factor n=1 Tax=Streptomyces griseoluteus TaxID=29306 RepID=UPI003696A4A4